MDSLQAIETVESWRRVLIDGKPEHIDQMLADLERRLKDKGWDRDPGMEAKMGRSSDWKHQWLCFVGGPGDGPQLMLCLARLSDRRVRGETYPLVNGYPGVQPSGAAEDRLLGAERLGQPAQDFGIDAEALIRRTVQAAHPDGVDGRLAADAATGCGKEIPLQVPGIERSIF